VLSSVVNKYPILEAKPVDGLYLSAVAATELIRYADFPIEFLFVSLKSIAVLVPSVKPFVRSRVGPSYSDG